MIVDELLSSLNKQKQNEDLHTLTAEKEANTTMADPVIGATVQVLLEKLISLTLTEINSSRDFNEDLEMLTQNVSLIQAFIHDMERSLVEKRHSVEQWLNRLERVAENAENVFDRCRFESLKTQVQNSPMKKVNGFFSHTAFKRKMSQKINNINKELTAINNLAKDLGLQLLVVPYRQILPVRETDSLVVASDVVGRDKDVAEIKEKILNMREEDVVLQTLRVNGCYSPVELPHEMANMISLRHIYYSFHWFYGKHLQMPLKMRQLTCLQTLQFFKVGLEKGRQIEELGHLKNLRGELMISGLQLVCNREEARTAHLQEKSNIDKLRYQWFHDEPECSETNDEYVLDGLQPHPNLKTLAIVGYLGTKFPSWFREDLLPNLVMLELSGCKRCKEIPQLGQLKLLRHLELSGFHKVECIGPTFYGIDGNNIGSSSNIQVFPSLKELVFKDMCSLIEWKGDEVGVRMFPGLEKLSITKCPLLNSTPNQFEMLRKFTIQGVDSEVPLLNLCSNLTSLVELSVYEVKELTCFPDEMLRNNISLQRLMVHACREFRELPQSFYNLHSLKRLDIEFCPNFSSFPVPTGENYLTSLQVLHLLNCDGLTSLPSGMLEHCRSLKKLIASGCNNLVSLPSHVWEMPSLSYLCLAECPKLISVPAGGLHSLTRLRRLEIGPFSEMIDFEAFQLIFNGIQQLSFLRSLCVNGCEHWDSLPYQLMELSALTVFQLYDFGIETLPHRLGNLTSLETLYLMRCKRLQHVDFSDAMRKLRYVSIYDCPLLEALLDGLGNLVSLEELSLCHCEKLELLPSRDVMLRLTKLCNLEIQGCPELEKNCTSRSGPNSQWSKISHIPKIKLGGSRIQDL